MNASQFLKIIQRPQSVTFEELGALHSLLAQAPYCQLAYTLIAKNLYNDASKKDEQTQAFIDAAAIYTTDIAHLQNFLEGKTSSISTSTYDQPAHNLIDKFPTETTVEETTSLPLSTEADTALEEKQVAETQIQTEKQEASSPSSSFLQPTQASEEAVLTHVQEEEATVSIPQPPHAEEHKEQEEQDFINGYINSLYKRNEKNINKETVLEQRNLIEQFIQKYEYFDVKNNKNTILDAKNTDLSKESTQLNEGLATESLAQIMAEQGKIIESIQIYDQLMVKYPQKKNYFIKLVNNLKTQSDQLLKNK